MARKKKQTTQTIRTRRPARTVDGSFRRNNVVVSRSQKEIVARQRSVTQRQIEKKLSNKKKAKRRKAIAGLLVMVLALFMYRSTIKTIQINSNASSKISPAQQSNYEKSLRSIYRANTIMGQSWLANESAIEKDFLNEYPEVERVSIGARSLLGATAEADVRFRSPVFTWQDASGVEQFVDKYGVLFSKNLDPSVNADTLIHIDDKSGAVLKAGTSVLTNDLIAFVGQLHSSVAKIFGGEKKIASVTIPKSTREVQIQVSGVPYSIKFNSFRDINVQMGELSDLLRHLSSQDVTPQEYIDVRVEHKAFYK